MSQGQRRWWLLAEDQEHERFALTLARRMGFKDRPIKVYRSPDGLGAASAWVRKQYPNLARTTVRQRPKESVVLLVMVDGDNEGVVRRKQQLDEALRSIGEPARGSGEPIVVLVPTWEIETWLVGRVDGLTETRSLKARLPSPCAEDFEQAAARVLFADDEEPLPSIRDAWSELERVRP